MLSAQLMRTPGYMDPELARLVEKGPPPASLGETTDIYALREMLLRKKQEAAATASTAQDGSAIAESDHRIPTRDGSEITVRAYRGPRSDRGPVMVMLHGGGFALGGLDNEAHLCRQWCQEFNGVSINVEYRLAPEFKFPTATYDGYDAVKWAATHPSVHGGDLEKGFIVAGISAGANIACTISHLARDDNLTPGLTGVYLSIPAVLSPEAVPDRLKGDYKSRQENQNALVLDNKAVALFAKLYQQDPLSPLMSPVIFPSHADMPPTYFQVAGADPLRDEGLIYERMLREEAGVPTKIDLYPGLPHAFWTFWPEAEFSKRHGKDSIAGLRWLLNKS